MKLTTIKSLFLLLVISSLAACSSTSVKDDKSAGALKDSSSESFNDQSLEKTGNDKANLSTTTRGFDPVVYFDFDKSVIKSSEADKIAGQAAKIKKDSPKSVTVEGHTDAVGTKEYNIALGERRANSTKKALVQSGVKSESINVVSYGKERLADTSHSRAADAKNRRTVTNLNK